MTKRKKYTSEFKRKAVRLMEVRRSHQLMLPGSLGCDAISSTNGKNSWTSAGPKRSEGWGGVSSGISLGL